MTLRDRLFSSHRSGGSDAGRTLPLIGNPNVRKSALFNRLTGGSATVNVTQGGLSATGMNGKVIDVPGTYSLEPCEGHQRPRRHSSQGAGRRSRSRPGSPGQEKTRSFDPAPGLRRVREVRMTALLLIRRDAA